MPGSCYFVSDLHMFSRRSQVDRYERDIQHAAANARTFVLGGDIFDFRWSTLSTTQATVAAAVNWLGRLVSSHAHCCFHFVLGNHDSNQRFVDCLEELTCKRPNFAWHHYFVRLGPCLFLHGDVANRRMDQQTLIAARSSWHNDERRSAFRHALYDAAIQARLHRLAAGLVYAPKSVAKRILFYLEDIDHGPKTGLRNVYFGHTHLALDGYEYGGLRFYNGGAPIQGLKFRIIEIEISEE